MIGPARFDQGDRARQRTTVTGLHAFSQPRVATLATPAQ
jgi:hypothetical protein